MADDHDALLTRAAQLAERWDKGRAGYSRTNEVFARTLVIDLAAALRESQADYHAALDVIGRRDQGWDARRFRNHPTWHRTPFFSGDEPCDEPMSDREWRVYCHAARRATHGNQT